MLRPYDVSLQTTAPSPPNDAHLYQQRNPSPEGAPTLLLQSSGIVAANNGIPSPGGEG